MSKINWLHISDIHFFPKHDWRDSSSRQELLDELKSTFKKDPSIKPDLILCTGDIAFGESNSHLLEHQYKEAEIFFSTLLEICGSENEPLSKDRIFLVPGNHDVNRNKINNDAQKALNALSENSQDNTDTINQRFDNNSLEFSDCIKRLGDFASFTNSFLPNLYTDKDRLFYTHKIEIKGLIIGIVGFNSAWSCSGKEDDRKIWIGASWQLNKAKEELKGVDISIGLIHHPIDWMNTAERDEFTRKIPTFCNFLLHGHTHNSWVTENANLITIAAGAVGANSTEEFGINITEFDANLGNGKTHLLSKKKNTSGWTILPISQYAPKGIWEFKLETTSSIKNKIEVNNDAEITTKKLNLIDITLRHFSKRLDDALRAFGNQPNAWVDPDISTASETDPDAKEKPLITIIEILNNPGRTVIKAPPQYGLTCLAHHLILKAWELKSEYWLYLDASGIKPNNASITDEIEKELLESNKNSTEIACIIIDSIDFGETDKVKITQKIIDRFEGIPILIFQTIESTHFNISDKNNLPTINFTTFYLWSLSREKIRNLVTKYNDFRNIGDDSLITKRIVSDLDVLNLHRTPLNCITLLKASEIDFDESPVNRSEVIGRVLFLLFNFDLFPSYKSKPDLKDCEYVLGYFCEILTREKNYTFSRDNFLYISQSFCRESLIELDINTLFDVLFSNNIIVKKGLHFGFKFSYWVHYFTAHRMHQSKEFADFIFSEMRYAQYPELIEFFTGIDRSKNDAVKILINDIKTCSEFVDEKCGFPKDFNPFKSGKWEANEETKSKMQNEITNGILESNLPEEVKDRFTDRHYDRSKPYDQTIREVLNDLSFLSMINVMKAGSRALRNSDYVDVDLKRNLLNEIMKCWEQITRVLFVILPKLVDMGFATYDGAGFILVGNFGKSLEERFYKVLTALPHNVSALGGDDLFSQKMGPLLYDILDSERLSDIVRHELILFLIKHRPKNWSKHIQKYLISVSDNSFYLMNMSRTLRYEYKYGYATPSTLNEIEFLIKLANAKHLKKVKDPSGKILSKINFPPDFMPKRDTSTD